jgi:mannosyltransferase
VSATTAERPLTPGDASVSRRATHSADRRWDLAAVLVPCALAVVLVFLELASRSLWLDEGATIAISTQHGTALWHAIAHDGGNMLGYYLFQHGLIALFGHAPAAIRAPSALATVVTVALVGAVGRRLFDRRVAFAAGLLAAVSLPLVFWGQDARAYAPMLMFICASFLALTYLTEEAAPRRVWIAWALSLVLATYMSFIAVLVIPGQLLVVGRYRRPTWRAIVVSLGAVIVACIPIAVLAARRGSGQLFWVPSPSLGRIDEMLRWVTSSGMPPNFHRTPIGAVLLGISLAALIVILVRALRRPERRTSLLVAWLLVPLVLSLAESLLGQPVALARTSLVVLPAASLLLAAGLFGSGAIRIPLPVPLAWAALAILLVLRGLVLAPSYGSSPENWKGAAAYVSARAQPGDCVAFYPLDGWTVFNAYTGAGAPLPTSVLPNIGWGPSRPYVERYVVPSAGRLAGIARRCGRVWLIASHEGQRDGPRVSRANLVRFHALQASLRGIYATAAPESRFGWAGPVRVRLYGR